MAIATIYQAENDCIALVYFIPTTIAVVALLYRHTANFLVSLLLMQMVLIYVPVLPLQLQYHLRCSYLLTASLNIPNIILLAHITNLVHFYHVAH